MPELESLQVMVLEAPKFSGFDLGKLQVLKELEHSRVPLKPSVFPSLSEIVGLGSLTILTVPFSYQVKGSVQRELFGTI